MNKKRIIVIVVDSMGCGAMEDAPEYGDDLNCNTLKNLADATGGLYIPNLEKMGFGNIIDIKGVKKESNYSASWGKLKLKSNGKLDDLAPTMLDLMNLEKPEEMTGESLLDKE